jgi:phospho-N-acetylmuramoyl-pentapeptide-transferase
MVNDEFNSAFTIHHSELFKMLYLLIEHSLPWLEAHHLGFFRVFTREQDPFRQVMAVMLAFLLCILTGPPVIRWLQWQKIGDLAGFDQAQLEELMKNKRGTPTMGGLFIVGSIVTSTLLLADPLNFHVRMAIVCVLWLAAVGIADDWLKLTAKRRGGGRQGLTGLEKILFQIGLGVLLSYFTYQHGQNVPDAHTLYFPFFKNLKVSLGQGGFILVGTIVLTGSSNAVNLTDGLDGLAAGIMAIVSFAFLFLALIGGQLMLATKLHIPHVNYSEEMAVIAAAMLGACLGFLWFNCNPARVFMGDTGSLALGGLIGYIAIVIRQEFMLFFVGGIFVIEALSVIIQVSYYKYTRIRHGEGRRVFLCSPIHHHFQEKGWTESQVVTRFWLISAMLAAMALATVKLR